MYKPQAAGNTLPSFQNRVYTGKIKKYRLLKRHEQVDRVKKRAAENEPTDQQPYNLL